MNSIDYIDNIDNMNSIGYKIIISKPLIITIIFLFITCFIIFIICSYFVINFLKISIDYNNIFFYQYNKKCQKIIDEYGDCKISKVYLVRQPFGKMVNLAFNMITFFNYDKYIAETEENNPYHPALIFEIKIDNKIKLLLLEKNNCINICETFLINKSDDYKRVPISKNKFTLNKILKATQQRIGAHKFYNWHIYKNNCQKFTKEILITLNKSTQEYNEFINKDKIMLDHYDPSDFTLHIVNCLFIIINFIEKYLLDNNIFY